MFKYGLLTLAALGSILFIQACAPKSQEDCGFVQNVYGQRISWKGQLPVTLRLDSSVPNTQDVTDAITRAADTWNKAAGKTIIVVDTNRQSIPLGNDRNNVLYFSSTWEAGQNSQQAKTSVRWVGDQIQEADIRVNASKNANGNYVYAFYEDPSRPNGVNLEALVLHEMGHVLGLKHKDEVPSVMATYLPSNTNRTQLSSSDESSLMCEY